MIGVRSCLTAGILAAWAFLALAWAQVGVLPDRAPYNTKVSVKAVEPGISLEAAIRSAARAAGVPVLIQGLPDARVTLDLQKVPFRRFLDFVLKLYAPEASYALMPEGVVLVAQRSALERVFPPPPKEAPLAAAPKEELGGTAALLLEASAAGEELARVAKELGVPTAIWIGPARSILLQGPAEILERAVPLLRDIEAKAGKKQEEAQAKVETPPPPPPIPAPEPPPPPAPQTAVLSLPELDGVQGLERIAAASGAELLVSAPGGVFVLRGSLDAVKAAAESLKEVAQAKAAGAKAKEEERATLVLEIPDSSNKDTVLKVAALLFPSAGVEVAGKSLVISGPKSVLEGGRSAMERVLASLAKPTSEGFVTRSYPIFGEGGKDLVRGIQLLWGPEGAERGYKVDYLEANRTLVVVAPPEVQNRVVEFLRQADPPRLGDAKVKVRFQLKHLSPAAAKGYLEALGFKDRVVLVAEEDRLGLWLEGPRSEVARAKTYLDLLDTTPAQVKLAVRVTQVERSALSSLDPSVQAALSGITAAIGSSGLSLGYALPVNIANLLSLNLQALEGKGQAKTLVSTENLVLSGRTMRLNSGGSLYVLQTPQSGGGNEGGGPNSVQQASNFPPIEYGLVLELTPTVSADKSVAVKVDLQLGSLPSSGPVQNTVDVRKKSVSSELRLPVGQTGVVGGLIYQESTRDETGVPILSAIPIIGNLFKSTREGAKETVLLVMITPMQVDVPELPRLQILETPEEGEVAPLEDPRTPIPVPQGKGESGKGAPPEKQEPSKGRVRSVPLTGYQAWARRVGNDALVYVGGGTGTASYEVVGILTPENKELSVQGSYLKFGEGEVAVLLVPGGGTHHRLVLLARSPTGEVGSLEVEVR